MTKLDPEDMMTREEIEILSQGWEASKVFEPAQVVADCLKGFTCASLSRDIHHILNIA